MKIGYPCINTGIGCTANSTFRLANYSEENMKEKIRNNLLCLEKILNYNIQNNLLLFRISSDVVPFASHPVCKFNWKKVFSKKLKSLGNLIKKHDMRISMHPDQFVLLNAIKEKIVENSIQELKWHCEFLDSLGLDAKAKVQIHVGGIYGDKKSALERFIENFDRCPELIKRRLAIENDERLFSLKDCLYLNEKTGIPVIFDSFHHSCLNNGEKILDALKLAASTWKKKDGIIMTDYSSQEPGSRKGKHISHIDVRHFTDYIKSTRKMDFDIMLEIKDKEKSALEAIKIVEKVRNV